MPHSVRSVPAQRPARGVSALARASGAGHAADRRVALVVQRVVGDLMVPDVVPDSLVVPVGERVQLPEAEALVPAELRAALGAGRRVDPADARDPAVDPVERLRIGSTLRIPQQSSVRAPLAGLPALAKPGRVVLEKRSNSIP